MKHDCLIDLLCCICGAIGISELDGHRRCQDHRNTQAPARETAAETPAAGSPGPDSLIPQKDGLFPDGSRLDDPDIPF